MAERIIQTDELEVAFVLEFKCPICSKYMFPPISQCISGHCFCSSCFENIRRCVICRTPKSNARCIVLEKMHGLLTFPCKYKEEGCDFIDKGESMKEHHNTCKFSVIICPLRFNNCHWRGHKMELVAHCKEEHPENIYFHTSQKLVSSDFVQLADKHYFILFIVYNTIFRCSWDVDVDTGLIRYAVYCLDKTVSPDKFSFEVAILQGNTDHDNEVIKLRGPCCRMVEDSEFFINGKYLVATYDMIRKYCDENGDLNYVVKIFETALKQ